MTKTRDAPPAEGLGPNDARAAQGRLETAVSGAGLGTWDYNPITDTLVWDARSRELFGLGPDDPVDLTRFLERVNPQDRPVVEEAIRAGLSPEGEGLYDREYRVNLPGHRVRWVRSTGRTFFEGSGAERRATRFAGVNLDITDRKMAAVALADETRTVEMLNRIGRTLTSEVEREEIIQRVTDEATKLVGARFGAFMYNVVGDEGEAFMLYTLSGAPREAFERFGMPRHTPIFHPTFAGERIVRYDDVTKSPEYGQWEPHRGMPEGHLPVRSYLAVPVLSSGGEVLGGLFFGHSDVGVFTERHERLVDGIAGWAAIALDNARLVQEARASASRAEQAVELRDEVLAIVSHDLRDPLSTIVTASSLITDFNLSDAQRAKQLSVIRRASERMDRLIHDLLDVAKIEGGRLSVDRAAIPVEPLLEEACLAYMSLAQEKDLVLRCEAMGPLPLIRADRARVLQVLSNLLSNALKHTLGGEIKVEARKGADAVRFLVEDTGTGIRPAELEHLFQRFWQTQQARRTGRGLGLGLAISKGIVEAHGGRIWAESEPGVGSKFFFTIPAAHGAPHTSREDSHGASTPSA